MKNVILKLLFLIFFVLIVYFPIFLNPDLVLKRGNDLEEFFYPIIYFAKNQILNDHQIPLWNNLLFSGAPLLPDPQSNLFYIPNIIFLYLDLDLAFIVSILLHILVGGIGMYLCCKNGLGFSEPSCLFASFLYISSPTILGFIEAGHIGLINSSAWLPFILLSLLMFFKSPQLFYMIIFAIFLALVFYSHPIPFFIGIFTSISLVAYFVIFKSKNKKLISLICYFLIGLVLTFGFIAIAIIPQLEWIPQTTRFLLLDNPDVYPKWLSKKEFLQTVILPWIGGSESIRNQSSEKWIGLGFIPLLYATMGFTLLKLRLKIIVLSVIIFLVLIVLNNISPLNQNLINMDWFILMRVSTRVWFIIVFLVTLLAAFGFEHLRNQKFKQIFYLVLFICFVELIFLDWTRIKKPINPSSKITDPVVYNFLQSDQEKYRVFCLNRCLSQKLAAIYNLELVEGYGTLQQKNYYNQFIQLSQTYWEKYTLSLPPFEIYNHKEIQPYTPNLSEYNVKYLIAPYLLKDPGFTLEMTYDNFYIYKNVNYNPRAYFINQSGGYLREAPIIKYKPNLIQINTGNQYSNRIVLSEVYNKDWKAYLNGNKLVNISETSSGLREVNIDNKTNSVTFIYDPEGFKIGAYITSMTLILVTLYTILRWKKLVRT